MITSSEKLGAFGLCNPAASFLSAGESLAYTSGSGASVNLDGFGVQALAPTSAIGYATRRWRQNTGGKGSQGAISGVFDYSRLIVVGARFSVYQVTGAGTGAELNSVFRFKVGAGFSEVSGPLTVKGFSVNWTPGEPLRLTAHDGASLTTVISSFTPQQTISVGGYSFDAVIVSKSGSVQLFVNGQLSASTSNGPTGAGAQFSSNVDLIAENIGVLSGLRVFAVASSPALYLE